MVVSLCESERTWVVNSGNAAPARFPVNKIEMMNGDAKWKGANDINFGQQVQRKRKRDSSLLSS